MENKCLKFSESFGVNDFKASPCWISATLKRNNNFRIYLHGEAIDIIDEDREIIISSWCKDFHANIAEADKPPEWVHNVDQTDLYYQKLPNGVYVDELNKKDYAAAKQMKYNTSITLMVRTSATENKYHLL